MEGEERRQKILEMLASGGSPISGSQFSKILSVSRQVIVQDIALLRAADQNIISTTRGYVLYIPEPTQAKARCTAAVSHEDDRMCEELYLIVDFGGTVLNVIVEHDVYGKITGEMHLSSRQDVDTFMQKIGSSRSQSLLSLTGGDHYHTIEAQDEATLDLILQKLKEKGFLK